MTMPKDMTNTASLDLMYDLKNTAHIYSPVFLLKDSPKFMGSY